MTTTTNDAIVIGSGQAGPPFTVGERMPTLLGNLVPLGAAP